MEIMKEKYHFYENSDDWFHEDTVLCADIEHTERWSVPLSPVFCSSVKDTLREGVRKAD